MRATALNRQSLIDIALQYGGTVDAAFEMSLMNNVSITADLVSGQQVDIPVIPQQAAVVNYYRRNGITPATAISDSHIELYVDKNYVNENYIENG